MTPENRSFSELLGRVAEPSVPSRSMARSVVLRMRLKTVAEVSYDPWVFSSFPELLTARSSQRAEQVLHGATV